MSFRTTLLWLAVAAGLLAFIVLYQQHARQAPPPVAAEAFPTIDPDAVDLIQVRPGNELEIRVLRTNAEWRVVEPLSWPAQPVSIERFLSTLATLAPAAYIKPAEVRALKSPEEEYGFKTPRASIILRQADTRLHMLVGAMTAPGDQFFLQVVGREGVYIFNADALKIIPANVNEWRDTALVDLNKNPVDYVSVTNAGKNFTLQRDAARVWRMIHPIKARADQARIHDALERTHSLRVERFVSDDPAADLESFGLRPAAMNLYLRLSTNTPVELLFGRSPTNEADKVFATRGGWKTVVTVPKPFVEPWQQPLESFRDPFVLSSSDPVQSLSVAGKEDFLLEWQAGGGWRIAPSNWPGDADLVKEFIARLNGLKVAQFVKDVVTEPDLPPYGLNNPSAKYVLLYAPAAGVTNQVELQLGIEQDGKIFARRTDEASIYALSTNEVRQLADAPWQLRQRRVWDFSIEDVQRVVVKTEGRQRELIRSGPRKWELGPGSQGMINELAVDETVRALCNVAVDRWAGLGAARREEFGIQDGGFDLTIALKDARTVTLQFGRMTPSQGAYAGVTLDNLVWIGEFPWIVCRDVVSHLAPPPVERK